VSTDPDHDVDTEEDVIQPVNHYTVDPREQQRLAFKLLQRHTHTHTQRQVDMPSTSADRDRETDRHTHTHRQVDMPSTSADRDTEIVRHVQDLPSSSSFF